jgi:two-component system response regulator MtrA
MATQVLSNWVPGSVGPSSSRGRDSDADQLCRSPHGHDRFTVLIVDDDESIAELLADLLAGEGYRAVIAHDGATALDFARTERPDMVLSDCMMPGLSGTQLAQELRRSPTTRSIALALMSSTRPRDLSMPNVPFLAKPFEIDDVLNLVGAQSRGRVRAQLYGEG